MSRNWIKAYPEEILYGSTFTELNIIERSIWWTLLFMAGLGIVADDGYVAVRHGEGWTARALAEFMGCKKSLIDSTLVKLVDVGKISILDNNIIKINKWHKYQSEYNRQKIYRDKVEPASEPKPKPINWKQNYAIGMDKERQREAEKIKEKEERSLLDIAKQCFKNYYDIEATCTGHHTDNDDEKPLLDKCKTCLPMQAYFKTQIEQPIVVEDYMQCSDLGNCYTKDIGGKPKYNFCQTKCAIDKNIWKEQANHWGNNIIKVKG